MREWLHGGSHCGSHNKNRLRVKGSLEKVGHHLRPGGVLLGCIMKTRTFFGNNYGNGDNNAIDLYGQLNVGESCKRICWSSVKIHCFIESLRFRNALRTDCRICESDKYRHKIIWNRTFWVYNPKIVTFDTCPSLRGLIKGNGSQGKNGMSMV